MVWAGKEFLCTMYYESVILQVCYTLCKKQEAKNGLVCFTWRFFVSSLQRDVLNRRVGAGATAPIFWLVTAMGPRIFDTDFLNNLILNKATSM